MCQSLMCYQNWADKHSVFAPQSVNLQKRSNPREQQRQIKKSQTPGLEGSRLVPSRPFGPLVQRLHSVWCPWRKFPFQWVFWPGGGGQLQSGRDSCGVWFWTWWTTAFGSGGVFHKVHVHGGMCPPQCFSIWTPDVT